MGKNVSGNMLHNHILVAKRPITSYSHSPLRDACEVLSTLGRILAEGITGVAARTGCWYYKDILCVVLLIARIAKATLGT